MKSTMEYVINNKLSSSSLHNNLYNTPYINESLHNTKYSNWSYAVNPPISPGIFGLSCAYLSIVGVIGTLSNSFILFAFFKIKSLRTPFNMIVLNLIATELIVSVFEIPVDFMSSFNRGWVYGVSMCRLVGFTLTLCGIGSVFTLCSLSVHRLIIVIGPMNVPVLNHIHGALTVILIWSFSLLVSLPPLFGWGKYVPELSGMSCAPAWEDPDSFYYTLYLFILGFFIPVIIIVICNVGVIFVMKQNTRKKSHSSIRGRAKRREKGATKIVVLMTSGFMVCWCPYAFICLHLMGGGHPSPTLSAIPLQFAKSSICWSPIVYVFCNNEFRQAIIKYFKISLNQSSKSTRFEVSSQFSNNQNSMTYSKRRTMANSTTNNSNSIFELTPVNKEVGLSVVAFEDTPKDETHRVRRIKSSTTTTTSATIEDNNRSLSEDSDDITGRSTAV